MIAYLKGTLVHKAPNQVIVDIAGVGYCAAVPLTTFFRLGEIGGPVALHIHTHLTDSSLSLFGFATAAEKDIFLKLIGVSGIGPRLALNVLSGIEPGDFEDAVRKSDVARLCLVPGIGKKTALRIAMELQDKMEKKEELLAGRTSPQTEDIVSALTNLGFRRKEVERVVERAVSDLGPEQGFEKLLRECLSRMAKL
jgi:holliday junction DNA helicase RuvA